jgi:hypothetical protein
MLNLNELFILPPEVVKQLMAYASYKHGGGWQSACAKAVSDQLLPDGATWKNMRRKRLQELKELVDAELRLLP